MADAGADQTVDINTVVTFDGSGSRAHAGRTIASYYWNFGSGAIPATGTGISPSCTYSTHGEKTVTLTVTDSGLDADSDMMSVTVKAPPVADAGSDKEVYLNSNTNSVSVSFDGSNSYDPDGGTLTYAWGFGDGSTGSGATPSHTYTSTGTYNVTLTVTDDEQVETSGSLTVTVQPDPGVLTAEAGPNQTVSVDSTVTFDGSGSYAPVGRTIDTYAWNFRDGNTGSGVEATHVYSTSGVYSVTLTITDDQGVQAMDTITVTVFKGTLHVDTNRLVISENPPSGTSDGSGTDGASGSSGAGGEDRTRSVPRTNTKTTDTTPPPVNLAPSTANITCDVLFAGFTPTSVSAEIHCGTALDATTLVKEITMTETIGGSDSYTVSWDGTDGTGALVGDGDFQIVGVVNHQANSHRSAAQTVSVNNVSVTVEILVAGEDDPEGTLDSSKYAAVDTEYDSTKKKGPETDEDITKDDTIPATIYYSIYGAGIEGKYSETYLKITREGSPASLSRFLGANLSGHGLSYEWDGRFPGDSPYGVVRAQIIVEVDVDGPAPGTTTPEQDFNRKTEQTYMSAHHDITVYSFPVAVAGEDKIVALKPKTDDPTTYSAMVNFDGSNSHDPDDILNIHGEVEEHSYSWEFPGGDPESSTASIASTEYTTPGEKFATLSVTDNDRNPHASERLKDKDTVKVTVAKITPVLTPKDNFQGRSNSRFGIEEPIKLSYNIEPSNVTAAELGGLKWEIESGGGQLEEIEDPNDPAKYSYVAPDTPGKVTLKLVIESGPSAGVLLTREIEVVKPTGRLVKPPNLPIGHKKGEFSVGFTALIYLGPKDVSFSHLLFREREACPSPITGYFRQNIPPQNWNHRLGSWRNIADGNITTGCQAGIDRIATRIKAGNWSPGEHTWIIPWEVGRQVQKTGDDGVTHRSIERVMEFTNVLMRASSRDSSGTAYIEKAGVGPFSATIGSPTVIPDDQWTHWNYTD